MALTPGVVTITISDTDDEQAIRARIADALEGAPVGEHVRLQVPDNRPTMLISAYCKPEYLWQVEAHTYSTKKRWMDAIAEGGARVY